VGTARALHGFIAKHARRGARFDHTVVIGYEQVEPEDTEVLSGILRSYIQTAWTLTFMRLTAAKPAELAPAAEA